jgi:hypothetical protein
MAGTWPITYRELYTKPTNNPFGNDEEVLEVCTGSVYELFRATGLPLDEYGLLRNIQTDFFRPIGGIGIFVPDGSSPTEVLRVVHGIQLFPGVPGWSHDRMVKLTFEGDVDGVDAATIAFVRKSARRRARA